MFCVFVYERVHMCLFQRVRVGVIHILNLRARKGMGNTRPRTSPDTSQVTGRGEGKVCVARPGVVFRGKVGNFPSKDPSQIHSVLATLHSLTDLVSQIKRKKRVHELSKFNCKTSFVGEPELGRETEGVIAASP